MIGTLFAQEFRANWKTLFGTISIALLVIALGFGLTLLRVPLLGSFSYGLAMAVSVMITFCVLGLLAESYWRTIYGREGYFTMALPVRGRTLFAAKVLYGVVVVVIALALTALCLAVGGALWTVTQGGTWREGFEGLGGMLDAIPTGMLWFLACTVVLQTIFTVVAGAAIMSIGAEARFNHLGFGAPVLGAVLLYIVMQVLALAAMLFIPFGVKVSGPDAGQFVAQGMYDDFVLAVVEGSNAQPTIIGLGILPVSIIVAAVLWWRGARSVERHTSLR